MRIANPRQAIRHRLALLPEDRKQQGLVLPLSVADNIAVAAPERLGGPGGLVPPALRSRVARRFVSSLRIKTPTVRQPVRLLSGGNQQKVVLAKWLCTDADILIFDEPTRGIDVGSKVEIYQLMNQLAARGAAILMISSELPEILGMSDRILVMHGGSLSRCSQCFVTLHNERSSKEVYVMRIVAGRVDALCAALRDVILVRFDCPDVRIRGIAVPADADVHMTRHVNQMTGARHQRAESVGRDGNTPFGRPVVPDEYSMSVPEMRSRSGSSDCAATVDSYDSYPSMTPSSISRSSTAGVVGTSSAAESAL